MLTSINTRRATHVHSQRICLESLCDVVVHTALPRFKGHGAVKLTGHRGACQRLLGVLPQEQRHLLALMKHGPNEQVVEVEGKRRWSSVNVRAHRDLLAAPGRRVLLLDGKVRGVDERIDKGMETKTERETMKRGRQEDRKENRHKPSL